MKRLVALLLAVLACAPPARAVEAFPKTLLFDPLLADPRWPSFAGVLQRHYRGNSKVLWSANFGESFPLVGSEEKGKWQFGFQAGVFTLYDMTTESNDMVNADFLVGLPFTWRRGPWSYMARVFHISSHLGDEFVLTNKNVDRLNLSYEALDAKVSRDLPHGFRLYAGGGSMFRKYPPDLKPLFCQAGGEYEGPNFARGILRPVAAADFQKHQQNGWGPTGASLRGGVQMQHRDQRTRRLQFLLEYYRGHDPNGQFFSQTIESLGAGLHAYF